MKPPTTPLSTSKTAAMTRAMDAVTRGYHRYTSGQISVGKLSKLCAKLHQLYEIAATPARRITRKKYGKANALLVLYQNPQNPDIILWLMLFTEGELDAHEVLSDVQDKKLFWLDYELLRLPSKGRPRWTWRRSKQWMEENFNLLLDYCQKRRWDQVQQMLELYARQPGFHGVREQAFKLIKEVRARGYQGAIPVIFYTSKIAHGSPVQCVSSPDRAAPKD